MAKQTNETVKDFIARVGRKDFEKALGHKTQVVTRAIADGVMPAHWFFACRDWCSENGIEVPEYLFRQSHTPKPGRIKQNANPVKGFQGVTS
jgi:hypothetical protein